LIRAEEAQRNLSNADQDLCQASIGLAIYLICKNQLPCFNPALIRPTGLWGAVPEWPDPEIQTFFEQTAPRHVKMPGTQNYGVMAQYHIPELISAAQ